MPRIAALAALAGCSPLAGSEEIVVISRGEDGNYGLHPREVQATDFHALRGETTEFIARPTVIVDADGTASLRGGEPLDVQYGRDGDHLVALDYPGLIAVTAYHHFGQAHAYFAEVGLDRSMGPLDTLYLPLTDYGGALGPREFHDNASFSPSLGAFLLFEERWLDFVPLAANEGVITHEFAHAVFHELHGGPGPGWDRASLNMWRSIDEGLADVHAVAFTGDPAFGRASAGRFVLARDVSLESLALTDELLASTLEEAYDPYPMGTVFAAVFWDYRGALVELGWAPATASRAMGELAYRSAQGIETDASGFHVADLARAAAEQTPVGPQRDAICGALHLRAAPIMSEVAACP